ncbi:MAG: flagellar export protein FliJ [Proteobacteria bacterium]|nr:flagellar export protein FliJ [Pseudomonadota bacterium]
MDKKRLEKILEIKEKQKSDKERELKNAVLELRIEKEKLNQLKEEVHSMEQVLNDQIITSNIELYYRYLDTLNKKINQEEIEIQNKDNLVKFREKELLQAYRETKAFNIMKDNVIKEEIKKVIVQEQKTVDFDYITRKFKK